ncbi:MAG: hypothetical protein IT379_11920 [Deltaproteobacteria bacterium]|nr:hypothetical protein [Deltaproteobacteria bacterium]
MLRGDDLAVVLEPAAWRHLEGYAPNGVVRGNVNAWLGRAENEVRLRTRHPFAGLRSGYAITSLAYTPLDVDDVARYAVQYLPDDARGVTRYDGRHAVIEASMGSPFTADEAGVGMLHRIITEITSADDTSHSLMIRYKAVRVACVNCTLITTSKLVFSHRHRTPELPGLLEAALAHASDAMNVFSEAWRNANRDTYRLEHGFDEREVFRRLVAHGHLRVVGEAPAALVEQLLGAWQREPGDTIAAVNRAITRAANDTAWTSPWAQDELETQAGRLLFGKLRELPPLMREQEEALAA